MSEAEEYAKAVQSVADLGTKALDVSEKLGGFFAKVFKEPVQEVSGMITDKLRFVRWRRLIQMDDEVNQILLDRGIRETRGVPPKLALPIFEESSLEDDPSLQYLWNHLLVNAMDPKFNGELRYGFIDMIKNITGVEALILNKFYEILRRNDKLIDITKITNFTLTKEQIMEMVGIDGETYQVSIYNLMRTQCIGPAFLIKAFLDEAVATYEEADAFVLTPLGVRFVEACMR
ncbi:MAG: Abi-alpha family protein [Desulfobaccales bacterium]